MRYSIFALIFATACDSRSTSEEYCTRLQTCNLLVVGKSVEECVQDIDTLMNQLPATQRDEVEYEVQQCLDHPACSSFGMCIQNLPGASSGSGSAAK